MSGFLTDEIFDGLRSIGDPIVDPAVEGLPDSTLKQVHDSAMELGITGLASEKWLAENAKQFKVDYLLSLPDVPGRPGQPMVVPASEAQEGGPGLLSGAAPPSGTKVALPDPDLVKASCDLFARYGSEIAAALLLAALPEGYAAGEGAKVLFERSTLGAGGAVSARRIVGTAQFVISVFTPPPAPLQPTNPVESGYASSNFDVTRRLWGPPGGQALRYAVALRIMHSLIRRGVPGRASRRPDRPVEQEDAPGFILNQEDLLATLLTFSVTVFEVIERFGVHWSDDEQQAFLYAWDLVGETLGIGDQDVILKLTGQGSLESLERRLRDLDEGARDGSGNGGKQKNDAHLARLFATRRTRRELRRVADRGTLRPQTVDEAREVLERLRERMWVLENDRPPKRPPFEYENFRDVLDDVQAGRVLLRALLDEASARLPARQQRWPIELIRELVPDPVRNRLALGATNYLGLLSTNLGDTRLVGPLAGLRRMSAELLRQRATSVADALFLGYLAEGKLTIPGLDASVLGYGIRN